MILRRFLRNSTVEDDESRGFDSFDLRLGDQMRGERATMGKSLLDVERELRIKASYVAAIENADPEAFDTPGFIPGYVRSYARYLGMEPDESFARFCAESGFSIAHGMSAAASSVRRAGASGPRPPGQGDARLTAPNMPYIPANESILSRIEPGAVGSVAVLIALISAIGYGGWSVLKEVQRVQVAPVENTPYVLADLDPLENARHPVLEAADEQGAQQSTGADLVAPQGDNLDRLYRPEALDLPVVVARDGPISTLDPMQGGTMPGVALAASQISSQPSTNEPGAIDAVIASLLSPPQVVAEAPTGVQMVAVRPAWVRVRAPDGTVIFEGIMNSGDTYDVPLTEAPATLRAGESGSIYFKVDGQHYGPVGKRGAVTANVMLAPSDLIDRFEVADISLDSDLERYVAELNPAPGARPGE